MVRRTNFMDFERRKRALTKLCGGEDQLLLLAYLFCKTNGRPFVEGGESKRIDIKAVAAGSGIKKAAVRDCLRQVLKEHDQRKAGLN